MVNKVRAVSIMVEVTDKALTIKCDINITGFVSF